MLFKNQTVTSFGDNYNRNSREEQQSLDLIVLSQLKIKGISTPNKALDQFGNNFWMQFIIKVKDKVDDTLYEEDEKFNKFKKENRELVWEIKKLVIFLEAYQRLYNVAIDKVLKRKTRHFDLEDFLNKAHFLIFTELNPLLQEAAKLLIEKYWFNQNELIEKYWFNQDELKELNA